MIIQMRYATEQSKRWHMYESGEHVQTQIYIHINRLMEHISGEREDGNVFWWCLEPIKASNLYSKSIFPNKLIRAYSS